MSSLITPALAAAMVFFSLSTAGSTASAQGSVSLMGGVHALNQNDTAFPEGMVNVPVVGTLSYQLSPVFAVEGEFTWLIPVKQDVELAPGSTSSLKTPHMLAYQANLRADLPLESSLKPYLAAGLGAMTFLSSDDSDVLPALDESQTVFAINFGAGVTYDFTSSLGLRADFREFAAFPGNDTAGLSAAGESDPIWMERGTVGLTYRF